MTYFISTIFWREVWPEMIFTAESGTPKCLDSAIIIAIFACPLTGLSFTQISKLVSLSFLIDSVLLPGFAFTKIFMVVKCLQFFRLLK